MPNFQATNAVFRTSIPVGVNIAKNDPPLAVHTNGAGAPAVLGASTDADGVHGESQSSQHSGVAGINNSGGPGVYGSANGWDGVHGDSQSSAHAGVSGMNSAGGPGIWCKGTPAANCQGDVLVTGTVTASAVLVRSTDLLAALNQLQATVTQLQTDINVLQGQVLILQSKPAAPPSSAPTMPPPGAVTP